MRIAFSVLYSAGPALGGFFVVRVGLVEESCEGDRGCGVKHGVSFGELARGERVCDSDDAGVAGRERGGDAGGRVFDAGAGGGAHAELLGCHDVSGGVGLGAFDVVGGDDGLEEALGVEGFEHEVDLFAEGA